MAFLLHIFGIFCTKNVIIMYFPATHDRRICPKKSVMALQRNNVRFRRVKSQMHSKITKPTNRAKLGLLDGSFSHQVRLATCKKGQKLNKREHGSSAISVHGERNLISEMKRCNHLPYLLKRCKTHFFAHRKRGVIFFSLIELCPLEF